MNFAPMSPAPLPDSPEAAEARAKAAETLVRSLALDQSEDFAFFLRETVQSEIDQAAAKALRVTSSDRERDNAAHVHEAMLRVKSWASDNLATARNA